MGDRWRETVNRHKLERCIETGKVCNPSLNAAAKHLKRLGKITETGVAGIECFQCKYCGYWHVGHKPKNRGRKRKSQNASQPPEYN